MFLACDIPFALTISIVFVPQLGASYRPNRHSCKRPSIDVVVLASDNYRQSTEAFAAGQLSKAPTQSMLALNEATISSAVSEQSSAKQTIVD